MTHNRERASARIYRRGEQVFVQWRNQTLALEVGDPRDRMRQRAAAVETGGRASVKALMPGKVVSILRRPGEEVEAGEGLVIIEAMKMQNEVKAPKSGRILQCPLQEGQLVASGALLFEIE